jgi:hypothetical protein
MKESHVIFLIAGFRRAATFPRGQRQGGGGNHYHSRESGFFRSFNDMDLIDLFTAQHLSPSIFEDFGKIEWSYQNDL